MNINDYKYNLHSLRVFHVSFKRCFVLFYFFHWSLSGNKSTDVVCNLPSILDDLKNVVFNISVLPLIFNISSLFPRPFEVLKLQLVRP